MTHVRSSEIMFHVIYHLCNSVSADDIIRNMFAKVSLHRDQDTTTLILFLLPKQMITPLSNI